MHIIVYFLDCLWENCLCVFADLEVVQVFPCRCELNSSEQGAEMEREVRLTSIRLVCYSLNLFNVLSVAMEIPW